MRLAHLGPRPGRRAAVLALAATAAVALTGVGTPARAASTARPAESRPPAAAAAARDRYSHVMVVVMENLSYATAVGLTGYRSLADRYAVATASYGAAHPSLPNYLDLAGGSTFGITSDCTSCYVTADNLGAQLSAAHVSWSDFSEGVPGACYLGPYDGRYAGKHNPFRYFTDIRSSPALCHHLVPLGSLYGELARRSALPRFSFVTPNLCHDGHDCPPSEAFAWLQGFVAKVTASSSWRRAGLLVVTWDEGDDGDTSRVLPSGRVLGSGGGGHIPTLLIAPGVPRHTVLTAPMSHEMLLATIEADFSLPLLLGARAWSSHTLVLP